MYVCMYVYVKTCMLSELVCTHVFIRVCLCVYMHACMYVSICGPADCIEFTVPCLSSIYVCACA